MFLYPPLMTPGSAVVSTTLVANALGIASISAYSASEATVRSISRSFARELLPRSIRDNAVSPSPFDCGICEEAMPKKAPAQTKQQMTDDNPMHRFWPVLRRA